MFSATQAYWLTALSANRQQCLSCGAYDDLSRLASQKLHRIALRAACVKRAIYNTSPIIPLKYLSTISTPGNVSYGLFTPPIPGTSLVVLNSIDANSCHNLTLWDYKTNEELGNLCLGREDQPWHDIISSGSLHRRVTGLVEAPGTCSFVANRVSGIGYAVTSIDAFSYLHPGKAFSWMSYAFDFLLIRVPPLWKLQCL